MATRLKSAPSMGILARGKTLDGNDYCTEVFPVEMMSDPVTPSPSPRPVTLRREPLIIGISVVLIGALSPLLPNLLAAGEVACAAAGLLLLQGLIRDLHTLRSGPTCALPLPSSAPLDPTVATAPRPPARCMCMESSFGALGLALGCLVLALGLGGPVPLAWWAWPLAALAVLTTGYFIKDLVIDWRGRRIFRVSDHREVTW